MITMTTELKGNNRCSAKFTLCFTSTSGHNKPTNITKIMTASLSPEMKDDVKRSDVEIRSGKNKIILNIAARDVSALRAAINSNLRLLCCAAGVLEKVIKNSPV